MTDDTKLAGYDVIHAVGGGVQTKLWRNEDRFIHQLKWEGQEDIIAMASLSWNT